MAFMSEAINNTYTHIYIYIPPSILQYIYLYSDLITKSIITMTYTPSDLHFMETNDHNVNYMHYDRNLLPTPTMHIYNRSTNDSKILLLSNKAKSNNDHRIENLSLLQCN